jgi:hypothetical protein
VVCTIAEPFCVHLFDHADDSFGSLRLALGKCPQVRDLGSNEQA